MSSYSRFAPLHLVATIDILRTAVATESDVPSTKTSVPIKTAHGTATFQAYTSPAVAKLLEPFGGLAAVRPPVTTRGRWAVSRHVVFLDEVIPVLSLIALCRFGPWGKDRKPYWLDGEWTNESLSNVGLSNAPRDVKKKSSYGPSGTKEYNNAWREANKARVYAAQKRYRERVNAERQAIRILHPTSDPRKPVRHVDVISPAVENLVNDPTFNPDDVFSDLLGPDKLKAD